MELAWQYQNTWPFGDILSFIFMVYNYKSMEVSVINFLFKLIKTPIFSFKKVAGIRIRALNFTPGLWEKNISNATLMPTTNLSAPPANSQPFHGSALLCF